MRFGLKKTAALILACCMIFSLAACSRRNKQPDATLTVYAPIDSILAVSGLVDRYSRSTDGKVVLKINYDDTLMHAAKIEAGYDCDIFITNDPIAINWLDADFAGIVYENVVDEDGNKVEANPNNNDKIWADTRVDAFTQTAEDEDGNEVTYTYTVAAVKGTKQKTECKKFIDFLFGDDAKEVYEAGGFQVLEQEKAE